MNRGKGVIVAIVVVAVGAAAFSVWYHYLGQRRALAFWGPTTALLIAEAPVVEVLKLDELSIPSAEVPVAENTANEENQPSYVEFGGLAWKVIETREAAKAAGLSNLRRGLVLDTTFDWKPTPDEDEPSWQFALGFNDGKQWATILFNFDSDRVALTGGKKTALLDPKASDEFLAFFLEQFPEPSPDGPGDKPAEPSADKPSESVKPVEEPPAEK